MKNVTLSTLLILLTVAGIQAQNMRPVTLPRLSQKASISQQIGISTISITYHRPLLRKRDMHKRIAPYGKVWRAGANENTIIELSHATKVAGQDLAAGKYGVHIIPNKDEWTVIFSKNYTSWGSYFYKKEEDALRIKVKPETIAYRESLTYEFTESKAQATTVSLLWGTTKISFDISVDVPAVVVANLRKEMRDLPVYFWQGPYLAAKYCHDNSVNLDEALTWINRSIGIKKNFQNLFTKSQLLAKAGKKDESKATKKDAFDIAQEADLIQYGYAMGKEVTKAQRYEHFAYIVKRFKTWTAYQSQGIVYRYFGEKEKALKSFQMALKKAPKGQKAKLEKAVVSLKKTGKK